MGTERLVLSIDPPQRGESIVHGFAGLVLVSEPGIYGIGVYRRTILSPDGLIALAEVELHRGYHCPEGILKDLHGHSWVGDEKHVRYLSSMDIQEMSPEEIGDHLQDTRVLVAPWLGWEDRLDAIGIVLLDPVDYDAAIVMVEDGVAHYCLSSLFYLVDTAIQDEDDTADFIYNGILPGALYLASELRPVFLVRSEDCDAEENDVSSTAITIDGQSYFRILDTVSG